MGITTNPMKNRNPLVREACPDSEHGQEKLVESPAVTREQRCCQQTEDYDKDKAFHCRC